MKKIITLLVFLLPLWLLSACAFGPDGDSDALDSWQIAKKKGKAYLDRGIPLMALPSLRRARELQPNDPDVLLMLGLAYDQTNRPIQALESLEQAHRLRPEDGQIKQNLGVALMRQERLDEARLAFESALRDTNFPSPEEIHFNLALLYKLQHRPREMLTALEQAMRIKPGFVPALLELASYHREMGRFDLEQKRLREILELAPNHGLAMERLADSYIKVDKIKEAKALLQAILSLEPGGLAARRATDKLAILENVP